LAVGAEPDEALHACHDVGRERAKGQLRAELEEGVGLEARLLGLPPLAGRGRGLHSVERQIDQVEVGLRVGLLPVVGKEAVEQLGGPLVGRLDLVLVHDRTPCAGVLDVRLEAREGSLGRSCRVGVAALELRLEVAEGGLRTITEGDRLL
jgi:hypothetical protein